MSTAPVHRRRLALAILCALYGAAGSAQQNEVVRLPPVTVIGVTPLPGLGLPLHEVPANVQQLGPRDIGRAMSVTPAELLDRNAASVVTSSATGNPFQPDLNYRGFTASPLLGTPQGMSVFLDGVRVNEVFGDVVNWDLVPTSALAQAVLIPGSNPVFGRNTLGGAVTLDIKDGAANPGTHAAANLGSFGRRGASVEHGGRGESLDWYGFADAIDEDGWREHSASRFRRAIGKLRHRRGSGVDEIGAHVGDTDLSGTQALPASMLDTPRAAYTWPDTTRNRVTALWARSRHALSAITELSGIAYWRRLRTDTLNSNVNAVPEDEDDAATNVRATTRNRTWGASLQWTSSRHALLGVHRLAAGLGFDAGTTDFRQSNTPAVITSEREIVNSAAAVPGAAARATLREVAAYAVDSLALGERATVMASARYQRTGVDVADQSGTAPALNGHHRFARLNPALGATYELATGTSVYAHWSQGMRVPTAMELTCADPGAPCSLPNIFVADPPLRAVVATTVEGGVRHTARDRAYSAAVYRTRLRDDIQFIASAAGSGSTGFFMNVGDTERVGAEVSASSTTGPITLDLRYGYTRARFLSPFTTHSPANAGADATGTITVTAGNRLPMVPAHVGRLRVAARLSAAVEADALLSAISSQVARGNENNADPKGRLPGYATLDLNVRWSPAAAWRIAASLTNVLDRRFGTFATLGSNLFRGPGRTYAPDLAQAEPFIVPALPRAVSLVLHYTFDGR